MRDLGNSRELEVIMKTTDFAKRVVTIVIPDCSTIFNYKTEIRGHKWVVHYWESIGNTVTIRQYWMFIRVGGDIVFDGGWRLEDFKRNYIQCFKNSKAKVLTSNLD